QQLLTDVDAHGAPGDAPSATDAARRPELVPPRRELVRQPLAIPVGDARAEVSVTGDPPEAEREAAVPRPLGRARDPVEVGGDADAGAEAGRADKRAIRAGQTALRDLLPSGVIRHGSEARGQSVVRHRVADPGPDRGDLIGGCACLI